MGARCVHCGKPGDAGMEYVFHHHRILGVSGPGLTTYVSYAAEPDVYREFVCERCVEARLLEKAGEDRRSRGLAVSAGMFAVGGVLWFVPWDNPIKEGVGVVSPLLAVFVLVTEVLFPRLGSNRAIAYEPEVIALSTQNQLHTRLGLPGGKGERFKLHESTGVGGFDMKAAVERAKAASRFARRKGSE